MNTENITHRFPLVLHLTASNRSIPLCTPDQHRTLGLVTAWVGCLLAPWGLESICFRKTFHLLNYGGRWLTDSSHVRIANSWLMREYCGLLCRMVFWRPSKINAESFTRSLFVHSKKVNFSFKCGHCPATFRSLSKRSRNKSRGWQTFPERSMRQEVQKKARFETICTQSNPYRDQGF